MASQHSQLSVALQNVFSSSSAFLLNELLNESTGNKIPLHLRGSSIIAFPLILRTTPPEFAPFMRLRTWFPGLPGPVSLTLSRWPDITAIFHLQCTFVYELYRRRFVS